MSVVFLRGVNVGKGNRMDSAAFARRLTEGSGVPFSSLLASGNFYSLLDLPRERLAVVVGQALADTGLGVPFCTLANSELARVLGLVPAGVTDKSHFLVFFSPQGFAGLRLDDLRAHAQGGETVEVVDGYLMVDYGTTIHGSALTAPLIDKLLGAKATGRNLNTLEKLGSRLTPPSDTFQD